MARIDQRGPKELLWMTELFFFFFHGYMSEYICPKCWELKIGAFYVNAIYMNSM